MRSSKALVSLLAAIGIVTKPAGAQIFAGAAVQQGQNTPLAGLAVKLLRLAPGDTSRQRGEIADSALTDQRGLFQLVAGTPGVYRVQFRQPDGEFFFGPVDSVSGDTMITRAYALPAPARVYFEFEVEKSVEPLPGNRQPRYPADLRARNEEGQVLAQFVVNERGMPELSTFKVLRAPDIPCGSWFRSRSSSVFNDGVPGDPGTSHEGRRPERQRTSWRWRAVARCFATLNATTCSGAPASPRWT